MQDTHMNPSQRNELHLILHIEYLLLVHSIAAIRSSLLLRRDDVRDVQLVLGQMTSQYSASLDVFRGVGMGQFQEHLHRVPGHVYYAQRARQQRISAVVRRLLVAIETRFRAGKYDFCILIKGNIL